MSYANRKEMGSNRTAAIVVVALLHVVLGYALISGFGYNFVKEVAEDLKTFQVEEEPPPPPEEPPPPPPDKNLPPPPPPLVRTVTPPSTISTTPQLNPDPPVTREATPAPPAPPAPPPPPPPPQKVEPARSKGSLVGLFSTDDYPPSAQRDGAEGTARASITVGADGKVTGCSITQSTGNSALDQATCNIIRRRAKFTPARDSSGQPTSDTVTSPPIVWRLEDE